MKYLTLRCISGAPECEPVCPAYIGATERDHRGRKISDKSEREVQEQVDDCKEVLDPENGSPVMNTVLTTIKKKFEPECLDETVWLLNAHPLGQISDYCVPGHKYSIAGLPGTKFLAHKVWAIWFLLRRWVWDSDVPGALVVDEMGLRNTLTAVAAAMIYKLRTEKVVMGLPLPILWGNTLEEWVNIAQNTFPRIIGEEREWYPLQRHNPVPCRLSDI